MVLGQRRRRFFGIELVMGCDAGPTLNRNWVGTPVPNVGLHGAVGLHRVYAVPYRHAAGRIIYWQVLNTVEWMLASTGDGVDRALCMLFPN